MSKIKIHFVCREKEKIVDYISGHTILDMAIMSELDPPYSCMEGDCGTCGAHLDQGKILGENIGGMITTCQAKPDPSSPFLKVRF